MRSNHQSRLILVTADLMRSVRKILIPQGFTSFSTTWHKLCQDLWHGYECRNLPQSEPTGDIHISRLDPIVGINHSAYALT
jgi:hypothetical protein